MSTTIHFNTKRCYSAHGQRITATLHDDGFVTFYDHDRHVDGEFRLNGSEFNAQNVMRAYDRNCPNTRRSWEHAMLKTGCNANYVADEAAFRREYGY